MHADKTEPQASLSRSRILALKPTDGLYAQLNAPNEYSDICFDDFVLFTRVAKQFARNLCHIARPDDEGVVKLLGSFNEAKINSVNLNKLRGFKNNPTRLRKQLERLLLKVFNLRPEECGGIIQSLINGPLA